MAEEPSWEDIFNPNPTPREPEPAPATVRPAAPAPAQDDPFAELFPTSQPSAFAQPEQAAPAQPTYPAQPTQEPAYPTQQPAQPTQQPTAQSFDQYPASSTPQVPTEPSAQQPFDEQQYPAQPAQQYPAQPEPQYSAPPEQARFPEQELAHEYPVRPAPAPQPEPADDPFAGLFPTAAPTAQSAQPAPPAAPAQPAPAAAPASEDPFARQWPAPARENPPAQPFAQQQSFAQQQVTPPAPTIQPPPLYPPTQAYPAAQQYPPTQQYPPVESAQSATTAPETATPAAPPTQQPFPAQQAFPAAQEYPPTQAYPTAAAAEPTANDPFADLFGAPAEPTAPQPTPASAPAFPTAAAAPSTDPFADLIGGTEPVAPAQAPAPAPVAPAAPALSSDPFADLIGGTEPAAQQAAPEYTPEQPFPTTATARFTPREEDDPFAALFGGAAPAVASAGAEAAQGRRDEVAAGRGSSVDDPFAGDSGGRGRDGGGSGPGNGKPRKRRRLLWLKITLPIVLVLALVGGVGAYGWVNYNEQVRALLGIPLPTDYTGNGNGKEVIVTIHSGDIGEDIAHTLHDKGVTLTFDAFYDLLLAQKDQPNFEPGNFALQEHMSAKAALKALLDPANKVTDKLLITEGTTLPDALQTIADTTGIKLADLQAASTDLASLGVPTTEHTLEGWLFPATYTLDGGQTAHDVLQLLVNTMIEHLDAAGVAADQRHNVLTLAAMIQRESGPNTDDFYKISRVFTNRLDQGINLESDATVAYGTGKLNTVYTTDAERADASNPYNTYANPGLPVGPIGLPGDTAIDAALHPADGPWLFFVPINLQTGETVFSETVEEHDAAVEQLQEWCAASPENDSYCQ